MSLEKLQSALADNEGYIIRSDENIKYITEFSVTDSFLFISKNASVFLTDSRYIEAANAKCKNCSEIVLIDNFSDQINELVNELGIDKIYTESEKLTVSQFRKLKESIHCPVESDKLDNVISDSRRGKNNYEKNQIIAAQRIAERAFDHILGFIKPGITEKDISTELDFFMLRNGADGISFETIAVSGPNSSMPHGVPGNRKIENGDFITMDYGSVVNGYHSDMTRTIAVGYATDEMREIYNIVLTAQKAGVEQFKAGMTCSEADGIVRSIIENAGYGKYFGHSTGHGVGIDIHERPSVSSRSKEVLKSGDIITVEPGIYLPGKFGIRIEDMVYITDSGNENLTQCEKELIIV